MKQTKQKIFFQRTKVDNRSILLAFLVSALGFAIVFCFRTQVTTSYQTIQLNAAKRMEQCETILYDYVIANGIPIETEDLNKTGLLGPEFTPLTTTLGQVEAKRTALNPNFAAMMVKYFHQANLKKGDTIAVGTSGSFPGLTLATLSAATEMGLNTKVIASFGSSMYGGTRIELPTPKMIRILKEEGLLSFDLLAVSPGGTDDHGESVLWADARETIASLAKEEGVEYIDAPTIEDSIARRLALFGEEIMCFVNVGGASANSGTSAYTLDFPGGLVIDPPRIPVTNNRGLIYEYAARNIPVINMLNVRELSAEHGLPFDPVPLPNVGEGGVYQEISYFGLLSLGCVILSLVILFVGRLKNQFFNKIL